MKRTGHAIGATASGRLLSAVFMSAWPGKVHGDEELAAARAAEAGRSGEDHVAAGALTAMLREGVRIPEDVRVVTMANWGLGPVYPVSLTRLEMNPYTHGDALGQMALDYLRHKKPQSRRTVPLKYIEGDSFR